MSHTIVKFSQLAPFLSILVGEKINSVDIKDIHQAVTDAFSHEIPEENFSKVERMSLGSSGEVLKTNYFIQKEPSWAPSSGMFDTQNHCFITFLVGDFFAFYFSEKGRKDEIRDLFTLPGAMGAIKPVSISHLYHNFVNEDEVKMLWLSDISGKSSYKVGSKVLGGDSVADALDPILDQFYMMSAVRTTISSSADPVSIGINPFKSSIWRGPCQNWKDFENRVLELLDTLNSTRSEKDAPISILAYPIADTKELFGAYDFTVLEYDALPSNASFKVKELLQKFSDGYTFEQVESISNIKNILVDLKYNGELCATYQITPKIEKYIVKLEFTPSYQKNMKSKAERIEQIFNKPEFIKCWFESGHAMVGGMLFKTEYKDVDFKKFIWAHFEDYDIFQEKPLGPDGKLELKSIGKQKSLFCWVKNLWCSRWVDISDFKTSDKNSGWLYCDDGSGEKADFIHFESETPAPCLTFIHVKAAKKRSDSSGENRRLSVGVHDIVVSQAIKNIRYYDRKKLCEALEERIKNAKHKSCWHNGKNSNAEEFLKTLQQFQAKDKISTRVIVVQPHTKKTTYEKTLLDNNVKNQLNTLLVSASNAILSSNTSFFVVGSAE